MSNDPQYEEKKNRILTLYNNPPKDGVVVTLDEKGSITVKQYGGTAWKLHETRIPDRQSIKGRVEFSAAYLPHEGVVFHRFSEKKNAQEVIGLIKQVRIKHLHTKLYVILDNHRMHTSKDLRTFVEQDREIELVYTPKHASWLNAVEQVFASIQKWVLNNSSYQSANEIVAMIDRHLASLSARLLELLKEKPYTFALKMIQMTNLRPS